GPPRARRPATAPGGASGGGGGRRGRAGARRGAPACPFRLGGDDLMLVHEAVLDTARRHPDVTAFVDADGEPIAYGELARVVTALAATLRAEAGEGGRVAIVAPKSPAAVMGMLATLTAGLAYVPVDPRALPERRDFIVRDAGCVLALVEGTDELAVPTLDPRAAGREAAELPGGGGGREG